MGFDGLVTPVVLAAGASSRMGRSKALLPLKGTTFLDHILSTLSRCQGVGLPVVVLSSPHGPEAQRAQAHGALVALNPDIQAGMLKSLWCGMDLIPPEAAGLLLCPVDHPLPLAPTVEAVVRVVRASPDRIVLPTHQGRRGHPVAFGAGLFDAIREAPLDQGARAVLKARPQAIIEVAVPDGGILGDIDTPEIYRRWIGPDEV